MLAYCKLLRVIIVFLDLAVGIFVIVRLTVSNALIASAAVEYFCRCARGSVRNYFFGSIHRAHFLFCDAKEVLNLLPYQRDPGRASGEDKVRQPSFVDFVLIQKVSDTYDALFNCALDHFVEISAGYMENPA